ncbi:MAG: phosphatase PAP2 family protein [Candidatus Poribacteria bacterium]|nr:phosphatase PAP2 family protein [Candidatus Poribacteria bacterium]
MNRFLGQLLPTHTPLLPPDWITIFYLAISGLLIWVFHKNLRGWQIYVSVHVVLIMAIFSLAFVPDGAFPLPLQIVRDWYPIVAIPILYWESPPLTQMVFQGYFDEKIMAWEDRLFKGQPSVYLSERFPSKVISEFLHLGYLSYYGIGVALAEVLYLQGRREAFHEVVFAEALTFNLCLIWYLFMPVTGPRCRFEKIKGRLADGFFHKLTHAIVSRGSAKGTAFPSSHVALAVIVVLCAARYDLATFAVLCPFGVGLVIGTVYGRFHYALDAVVGTALGIIVFGLFRSLYWLLA